MVPGRPNILWILTTQWRASAFGYAGDRNARTPVLDALAAASTNYAQAVTPHPFGPFARAAVLTGLPAPENGIRDYFDPLPKRVATIAPALARNGYATAYFGKWHLAKRAANAPLVGEAHAKIVVPPDQRGGFQLWEGFESGFLLNHPWLHGTRLPEPVQFPGYQSDVVCARAEAWIRSAEASSPWFCVVSLEAPHPPYDAPAAGISPRAPREIELPANVPRGGDAETMARRELAGYYAHGEATDRAIGRLLAAVPAPTIVVFTSVHGDMHGAHGLFRKGWPYEEAVRVPLLVRLPPALSSGPAVSLAPVSLLHLPAWTLDWSTGAAPATTPSPAFARISMPSAVRLPWQCDRPWHGLRTPQRKLVLGPGDKPWLFFDLAADPGETNNLANDPAHRAEIAALAAEL